MPDERVSIVGTLEGNLTTQFEKVAGAAAKVDKSVIVADKDLQLFKHSLEAIGTHVKELEKADLGAAQQGLKDSAVQADAFDSAQGRAVARSAKLVQRLLSLQLVLQTIASAGPGSFGKLQSTVDAGSAALSTFAGIASLFPNQFGLIAGAIGAAGAAIGVFSKQAEEAEANLKAIKDQIAADRKEIAAQRGKDFFEDVVGGDAELTAAKRGLDNVKDAAIKALSKVAEARMRLNALTQDPLHPLPGAGGARLDLDKAAVDSEKFLRQYRELADFIEKREGMQKIVKDFKELEAELDIVDQKLELKVITPLQALQEKAEIAARKLKLAFDQAKLGPGSTEFKQTVRDQAEELKGITDELQQQKDLDEEIRTAREADAMFQKGTTDFLSEQAKEKGQEINEFYTGIAQGIGQAFAEATSQLIDGLIQGNLNFREFASQFLLQIGKMILQAIVLKGIMAGLGVIGLNEGGAVPIARASGGPIPGPNVDADVVPAMLTPGEFVMRREAVDLYGPGAMHALNRGMVPASLLRASAGSSARNFSGRFAEGGEVPFGAGAAPKPAMAFVVSSNQELERLIAGGEGALMRFFDRNSSKLRSALRIKG